MGTPAAPALFTYSINCHLAPSRYPKIDDHKAQRVVSGRRQGISKECANGFSIPIEFINKLGNALQNLTRYDKAIKSYVKAISINPHYSDAYYGKG